MGPNRDVRLWYHQPARQWLEALPLGNGSIGAMLWGEPHRERADLNIDTLWSGGPRTAHVENSQALLAELRAAVLERRAYAEADALALRLQGSFNEAYQPLGWLTVDVDGAAGPHNYERSLDISGGVATVRYEVGDSLYEREAFVSVPHRAFVMHFRVIGPGTLDLEVALGSPHPSVSARDDDGTLWLEGKAPAHVVPHYWPKEPAVVYDPRSGLRFAAGLALKVEGGVVQPALGGALRVEGAEAVTLSLSAATGYTGYDLRRSRTHDAAGHVPRRLIPLAFPAVHVIRARHVQDHRHFSTGAGCILDGRTRASPRPTSGSRPCAKARQTRGCPHCCSITAATC